MYRTNGNPVLAGSALTKEPSALARLWAYSNWPLIGPQESECHGLSWQARYPSKPIVFLFAHLVSSEYQTTFCFLGDHRTEDRRVRLPHLRNGLSRHRRPFPSLSGQPTDGAVSEIPRRKWFSRASVITFPWCLTLLDRLIDVTPFFQGNGTPGFLNQEKVHISKSLEST